MRRSVLQRMPKSTQIFRVKISWFVVGSCLGKAIPTEIHRPLDKMEVEPISAGIPYDDMTSYGHFMHVYKMGVHHTHLIYL